MILIVSLSDTMFFFITFILFIIAKLCGNMLLDVTANLTVFIIICISIKYVPFAFVQQKSIFKSLFAGNFLVRVFSAEHNRGKFVCGVHLEVRQLYPRFVRAVLNTKFLLAY